MFKPATGKDLDRICEKMGVKRKRWFWIFKERDKSLRKRTHTFIIAESKRQLAKYVDDLARKAFLPGYTPANELMDADDRTVLTMDKVLAAKELCK